MLMYEREPAREPSLFSFYGELYFSNLGEILIEMLNKIMRSQLQKKIRKTFIIVKAISLVIVVSFVMLCLCICALRMDNPETLIHVIIPVISGVLAFYAGRKSS